MYIVKILSNLYIPSFRFIVLITLIRKDSSINLYISAKQGYIYILIITSVLDGNGFLHV